MKLYTSGAVEKLANQYIDKGGEITTLKEGSLLGYGLAVFSGLGLRNTIVQEVYLNEWSSAYKVRFYDRLPKKYWSEVSQ